jgi:hypothetical protein
MVSEGDLIGRGAIDREARRDWWLTLLVEGGRLVAILSPRACAFPSTGRAMSWRRKWVDRGAALMQWVVSNLMLPAGRQYGLISIEATAARSLSSLMGVLDRTLNA